jgi:hypothetical protein
VAFARRKADIGVKVPFPEFVEPALASSIEKVPSGSRWIHEIKFDGYRVQVHLHNETVRVFIRRGHDWTKRFKKVGALIELGPTAMIELTGLRTPCVLIDRFQAGLKRQVLSSAETGPPFKCGVLGVVRAGGAVAAGDIARIRLLPRGPRRSLPTTFRSGSVQNSTSTSFSTATKPFNIPTSMR